MKINFQCEYLDSNFCIEWIDWLTLHLLDFCLKISFKIQQLRLLASLDIVLSLWVLTPKQIFLFPYCQLSGTTFNASIIEHVIATTAFSMSKLLNQRILPRQFLCYNDVLKCFILLSCEYGFNELLPERGMQIFPPCFRLNVRPCVAR